MIKKKSLSNFGKMECKMEEIEIKSTQNDLVKYVVKLQNAKFRKANKLIFVDGDKTMVGLIDDGVEFEYIFLKKDNRYLNKIKAKKIIYVNDKILDKISSVVTPCSMVGIIKEPEVNFSDFLKFNKIVLLDGIKDAGNLGTIIRSACAFLVDGIILVNDCVDIYNSKTIRSAAQNMFKIPIIHSDVNLIHQLKKTHTLISTVVNSKNDITNYKFPEKYIVAFGSEASGLSEEVIKLSDDKVTLLMDNNVESLNIAVFASITFAMMKLNQRFICS